MYFKIAKKSKKSRARCGVLETPHGSIETPAFTPVATQAALKGILPQEAKRIETQILMVNTYHLWVRGAVDTIKIFGGLHNFMRWDGPIMSDSGGFQVFSLGSGYNSQSSKIIDESKKITYENSALSCDRTKRRNKGLANIDDQGVTFRSHLDGRRLRLTPKVSIGIQEKLGADIIFALDECTSPFDSYEYNRQALGRTHAWATESLKAKKRRDQLLFGIVQGGRFKDLRQESARFIASLPFDGFGIGGGFGKEDVVNILKWSLPLLPEEKPRHYLGIGEISDIIQSVKEGIDLFDCVIPTRLARHETLITAKGKVTISNTPWRRDKKPPEEGCSCFTCQNFSRAYLAHLARAREFLLTTLATIHNIFFYNQLMKKIRNDILHDTL